MLSAFSLSKDGKYVAYGISEGGSDWVTLTVMEVATRQKLTDEINWMKYDCRRSLYFNNDFIPPCLKSTYTAINQD